MAQRTLESNTQYTASYYPLASWLLFLASLSISFFIRKMRIRVVISKNSHKDEFTYGTYIRVSGTWLVLDKLRSL